MLIKRQEGGTGCSGYIYMFKLLIEALDRLSCLPCLSLPPAIGLLCLQKMVKVIKKRDDDKHVVVCGWMDGWMGGSHLPKAKLTLWPRRQDQTNRPKSRRFQSKQSMIDLRAFVCAIWRLRERVKKNEIISRSILCVDFVKSKSIFPHSLLSLFFIFPFAGLKLNVAYQSSISQLH